MRISSTKPAWMSLLRHLWVGGGGSTQWLKQPIKEERSSLVFIHMVRWLSILLIHGCDIGWEKESFPFYLLWTTIEAVTLLLSHYLFPNSPGNKMNATILPLYLPPPPQKGKQECCHEVSSSSPHSPLLLPQLCTMTTLPHMQEAWGLLGRISYVVSWSSVLTHSWVWIWDYCDKVLIKKEIQLI